MTKCEEESVVNKKLQAGIYSTRIFPGECKIWSSFVEIEEKKVVGYVICQRCSALYTHKQGISVTSTLHRHRARCAQSTSVTCNNAEKEETLKQHLVIF